jgi:hypothetical protein
MRGGAGDRGLTVAKALRLIEDDQLQVDRCTVIVVDEASMVGTAELRRLIEASTAARAKMVLVGDAYQLAPVKAGGGMFAHLCGDLPWSQRLSQVWRMRDPGERDASLALRSARGNRLRKAVGLVPPPRSPARRGRHRHGCRCHRCLPQGPRRGKDAAILCDTCEIADAINQRLRDHFTDPDSVSVSVSRDQQVRVGDIVLSRRNGTKLIVEPAASQRRRDRIDQVRNVNCWRVIGIDSRRGHVAAERLTECARAVVGGDYLREHVTLGYAGTVASG